MRDGLKLFVGLLAVLAGMRMMEMVKGTGGDCACAGPNTTISQVYDPGAIVVVDPGLDGLPGRAGIDDGGNGVTDEVGELGATGSDDVCRVVPANNLDSLVGLHLDLQIGAFRDLGDGESVNDFPAARRVFVACDEDGVTCEWFEAIE
ncbi:hypothetical protein Pla22_32510 [Rubripirellula amarantea]|uniref:Uncharacterized protein n=1 Tax=Rubripirellula amarantea TaxID=2527999 RepID=A0A5C5WIE2_9BACT|nr:hypothetical protein [Rubripirellula amarantea]TWT50508.1 hypothetical protein Pla22_32510 [Rubripirellula amarantea]